MYPWRTGKREFQAYAPGWDPIEQDYAHVTLDLSHSSTAGGDPVEMARAAGDRLAHIHIADGSGSAKDEHLVPGRGTQPCKEFLEAVAGSGFAGEIVVEINTRKAKDQAEREVDLLEALAFTRLHASV
jgi:sugar phosphate isomerase/epimerase